MALGYEVHEITTYVPRSALLVGYMCMQTAPALTSVHTTILIHRPEEIASAEVIVFPGVGSFGSAMDVGYVLPYYKASCRARFQPMELLADVILDRLTHRGMLCYDSGAEREGVRGATARVH